MTRLTSLDEPLELGPVRLANRAVLCTAGVDLADPDGQITDRGFDWVVEQARRGWGMVLLELGRGVGPPTLEATEPEAIARLSTALASVPLGISVSRATWSESIDNLVTAGVCAVELEAAADHGTQGVAVGVRHPSLPAARDVDWIHVAPDDEAAARMWAGSPQTMLADETEGPLVMVSGRIRDAREADQYLARSAADLVGIGRGALADPDLLDRARRDEPWMPCTGCMACRRPGLGPGCAVSSVEPFAAGAGGSSWTIVGASLAAMRVAVALHRCGHEVSIFTGGQSIGGGVRLRGRVPEQQESADAAVFVRQRVRECGLPVNQALPEFIESEHTLVSLPGHVPPELDGVDARDVLGGSIQYGHSHAVFGDTLLAAETGVLLASRGVDVTLVCRPDHLCADNEIWARRWREWLDDRGVSIVAPDEFRGDVDVTVVAPRMRRTATAAAAIRAAVPDAIVLDDPYEPFAQRNTLERAFALVAERLTYM